ncbi:hypothetical protein GA0061100_107101 [Rhizobium hainanense]|uniref:Uncharacterized protein n=1 Tax=Rhizobium hainanense TaxID=52131 RepID=A0A1C3VNV5_9HYPH|nr:hypothetical protein GA0061100_107101 [Rhizobium hainanense]
MKWNLQLNFRRTVQWKIDAALASDRRGSANVSVRQQYGNAENGLFSSSRADDNDAERYALYDKIAQKLQHDAAGPIRLWAEVLAMISESLPLATLAVPLR